MSADKFPIFLFFNTDQGTPARLLYFLDAHPATLVSFVQVLFDHARAYQLSEEFVAGALRGACEMLRVWEIKKQEQQCFGKFRP